jgi:uncharacterized membrane protein YjjP (DUF1212 family)
LNESDYRKWMVVIAAVMLVIAIVRLFAGL